MKSKYIVLAVKLTELLVGFSVAFTFYIFASFGLMILISSLHSIGKSTWENINSSYWHKPDSFKAKLIEIPQTGSSLIVSQEGGNANKLNVNLCGFDIFIQKVKSRNYLRSLMKQGNGDLTIVPATFSYTGSENLVAEVFMKTRSGKEINLNLAMLKAGMGETTSQGFLNCPNYLRIERELSR